MGKETGSQYPQYAPVGRWGSAGRHQSREMEQLLQAFLGEEEGGEEAEGPEAEVSFQEKCRVGGRGWYQPFPPKNPAWIFAKPGKQPGGFSVPSPSTTPGSAGFPGMWSWIVPTVP